MIVDISNVEYDMQPSRIVLRRALSMERSTLKFEDNLEKSSSEESIKKHHNPTMGPDLKEAAPLSSIKPSNNLVDDDPQMDDEKIIQIPQRTITISNAN